MLIGAAIYAGLDFWFDFTVEPRGAFARAPAPAVARSAGLSGGLRRPVPAAGSGAEAPAVDTLRGKLRDVLARFDEIQVVAAAPPGSAQPRAGGSEKVPAASRYDLTASVQRESAGRTTISIRLTDAGNGRVVYARGFEQVRRDGELAPSDEAIAHEVAAALAQPYGIIQAYERGKEHAAKPSIAA